MTASLKDINNQLTEQMLRFLWRQWSAIGVAGHAEVVDHWVIDPEALLLVSSEFARHDSRLFDEILDWLHVNGNLINLKRVFNIRKKYPVGNPHVMRAMGKKLLHNSTFIKWKTVGDKSLSISELVDEAWLPDGLIDLFPKIPFTMEALQSCDEDFRACGFYRPKFEPRKMSQSPDPHAITNLIFKMRALFGCNSRAEIMAWLLTHPKGHPAEIARDTHYFSKSVQATLNEMAGSGMLHVSRSHREKFFRIDDKERALFHGNDHVAADSPHWQPWPEIFATIQLFCRTVTGDKFESSSELFQASMLKQTMEKFSFTQGLLTAGTSSGVQYLHTVVDDIQRLVGKLNSVDKVKTVG